MTSRLTRLLSPRTLAVLGGAWADTLAEQCAALGYAGTIYRVHPRRAADGVPGCWPDLASLPEAPDATFIGVNRETSISVLTELNGMGAGGALCFASGFRELQSDEGRGLESQLRDAAGELPFLGPNCYGMVNFFDRMSMWPDQVPRELDGRRRLDAGVAVITQSGTVGCNVIYAGRSVPLGFLVAVGNQTSITIPDLVDAMARDERVTAIGVYAEGITDLAAFARAVDVARGASKPVVALKTGRSEAATRTVLTHTGALGSEERYVDALFERLGVARVNDLAELLETLKLLHVHGPLPGNRVAVCSPSGGDMAIAADVVDPLNVELPDYGEAATAAMRAVVGERVDISNPMDYQIEFWHQADVLRRIYDGLMLAPADMHVQMLDLPNPDELDSTLFIAAARAWIDACADANVRGIIGSSLAESLPRETRDYAFECGVAPLQGMRETFAALEHAAWIGERWANPSSLPLLARSHAGTGELAVTLTEAEAKAAVAAHGVPVPAGSPGDHGEAVAIASRIGFPVAIKASGIAHKTEQGGVVLNVPDAAGVQAACATLERLSDTVLVEAMVTDALAELIVGVDVDPQFGPVLILGAGGILTELMDDSVVLLPSASEYDIRTALAKLRVAKLLDGFRGRPRADIDAVVKTVLAIQDYALANAESLVSLDINPLMVRAEGQGAVAADVLITKRSEP